MVRLPQERSYVPDLIVGASMVWNRWRIYVILFSFLKRYKPVGYGRKMTKLSTRPKTPRNKQQSRCRVVSQPHCRLTGGCDCLVEVACGDGLRSRSSVRNRKGQDKSCKGIWWHGVCDKPGMGLIRKRSFATLEELLMLKWTLNDLCSLCAVKPR